MTKNHLKTTEKEAIAIIGIGCRFPGGVNSPETFWNLLQNGTDAIVEIPEDRWNLKTFYDPDREKSGKTYVRWGGFLDKIDQFDAQFFRISPREAALIDPQQRLLLEVAWEALEDGGQVPEQLAGSNTSVFVGLYIHDYQHIQLDASARNLIGSQMTTGTAMSIAANRISYIFDFHGASMSLDTACSSSLVGVHLACQSIWNGESNLALAGGVNAILKPDMTIGMSKASMLSPDGRCKSFDAQANGFVRGEGAGMVLLKPLSQAIADKDPIYAVIRGSAVNQDGHTNGITVPNGLAQEAAIRAAYQQAGVLPEEIQYIEAHGTGTAVGDPIEANALGAVVGKNRLAGNNCIIGSVKSNIGHLESAAGVAGLVKAALALKHRQIPGNLNFETPNPKIDFEKLHLRVPQTLEPWPENGNSRRLAGVNSFGFGGTNAHLVLEGIDLIEELPQSADDSQTEGKALLLPLSARSSEALEATAQKTREFLSQKESDSSISLKDICYSASLRRGHHDHRLTLVADSKAELLENLKAFLDQETRLGMSSGRLVPGKSSQLAFVFSGMGPQWWAMGRELLESEPIFQETIQQCDVLLRQYTNWSLWEELTTSQDRSRINETQIAQPAIFAVQVALYSLWRSWGIEPDVIIGHSVGEVAAAHVAGVLSLEDAIQVIFHRSRVQAKAAGKGKMLAVGLSSEEVASYLEGYEEKVSIAAINSPNSVTLAGDSKALEEIAQSLEQKEIFSRLLRVEVPYHSPLMEPLKRELSSSLQAIKPQTATIPLFSTVTSNKVEGPELNGDYWADNMRNPVLFAAVIDRLIQDDYELFLELSAHPVLANSISECLAKAQKTGTVLPSLRRKEQERAMMLGSFGELYTLGYSVDWKRLYPQPGHFVQLPSYPWQRESYWQESEQSRLGRLGEPNQYRGSMLGQQIHPLLGSRLESPSQVWHAAIDKEELTYLNDHCVQGAVVYPGAAYIEMALAAAKEIFGTESGVIEEIEFQKALLLPESGPPSVQLTLDPEETYFDIYSKTKDSKQSWIKHVTGKLNSDGNGKVQKLIALDEIRSRCTREVSQNDCYKLFDEIGLQYGPSFQGIQQLWSGDGEALGKLKIPNGLETEVQDYQLHPTLLDACFQVLLGAVFFSQKAAGVYLPVGIDKLRFYSRPGLQFWSYARLVEQTPNMLKADIEMLDEAGNILVKIQGLRCQSLATARDLAPGEIDHYLYQEQWQLKALLGKEISQPADYLPNPVRISQSLQPEVVRLSEQLGRQQYYQKVEPQLETLSATYAYHALEQLGWKPELNQPICLDSLAKQLKVVSQHRSLLGRMLEILEKQSILKNVDEQWEIIQLPARKEPQEQWKSLLTQFPAYQAELMLLGRCAQKLPEVLRGEIEPLELIFPEGSLSSSEHLYQDSPSYRIYNRLVQKAIAKAIENLPEGRKLRILEIGAGTGSMTSYVLPKLPADRTEYVFTDVSQIFTIPAEQKFRDYPFVEYQVLNIETDPVSQGFDPHSFDLILASDVVHATGDLPQTLTNIKQLIASNGLLLLLELTDAPSWFDLVFGMLKGWWAFVDKDLRSSHPLLPLGKWQNLLKEVGFKEVAGISDTDGEPLHAVILAQGPDVTLEAQPELTAPLESEAPATWLIFADKSGVGQQLANLLTQRSETPILIFPGKAFKRLDADQFQINPELPLDVEQLLEAVNANNAPCRGVVHLWSLDITPTEKTTLASLESDYSLASLSILYLVQSLTKVDQGNTPRLVLVTCGSQAVGSSPSASITQSSSWGLGRVINNEHPNFGCTKVDISSPNSSEEIQSLFAELSSQDLEDEIILRGTARYVNRLTPVAPETVGTKEKKIASEVTDAFRLEVLKPGLDNLRLRKTQRQKPAPGEVEIQVIATGLNFEDLAKTKNFSTQANQEQNLFARGLGLECTGIITAVGEEVEGFELGDEVIAFAPNSFSSYVTTDARLAVPKPRSLSFEEAATIPLAFLTAYYALNYLGRIDKGERILIYNATESVGLAAIQIAQVTGAEIVATADSSEKLDFLRTIGVKQVIDSRSIAFADQVMECTNNQGIDLVFKSLPGENLAENFSILSAYGRFIQIGKQNIDRNHKLNLRSLPNNLSFFAVDIEQLLAQRIDLTASQLQQIIQHFAKETFHPLPHRVFAISKVNAAFRYGEQAQQIGKIILSLQDPDVTVASAIEEKVTISPDGTYLITGGLGGFSLAVVRWLIQNGAKHLVLMGRSGASSPAAQAAVNSLKEEGANVVVAKADVTQEKQVAKVIADINEYMPPLRGIMHAAMVLDDVSLLQMNQENFKKVMAPKVIGAWNLHSQTANLPLDLFILFSSISSIVGNPGQGNYVAANAFLDALAHHRRAQGLSALTVNWGAVTDVGYVAQNAEVAEHLKRIGIKSLRSQEAMKMFGVLLQQQATQTVIANLNWQQWAKFHPAASLPRFSQVVQIASDSQPVDEEQQDSFKDKILAAELTERKELLESCLREQVARVLLTSASKVDIQQPLISLGFDSLMAVELSNNIKKELDVDVPTVKLVQGPSIAQLVAQVGEQLYEGDSTSSTSNSHAVKPASIQTSNGNGAVKTEEAAQVLTKLDELSDTEIDALLNSELGVS